MERIFPEKIRGKSCGRPFYRCRLLSIKSTGGRMFGKTYTSAIVGIDGRRVIVEADYGDGLPAFEMVGFLSSEVREARERVKAALKNSGFYVPPGRLTVNLSPADLRKQGNSFDLPIAIAILIALGILPQSSAEDYLMIGELSLDGRIRGINGTLSHVLLAKEAGKRGCIVPKENAREGAVLSALSVYGFETLADVVSFLVDPDEVMPEEPPEQVIVNGDGKLPDFSEIRGQESAKRAAEVASAGMHGLLLIGPPGTGKTLTAKRIPTILPPLTEKEQIESSKIHSVAGTLDRNEGLLKMRPFRSPHHTVSANGLVGGGSYPRPGEMSLAHNGVLFLDELPEFSKLTLEVMRQPLEDRRVVISRVNGSYVFPTRVMLVCAMNPCRCGYYPDRTKCRCSDGEVQKYLGRISKPLLDRIDIAVEVPRIGYEELERRQKGENSEEIRERVIRCWEVQKERYRGQEIVFNSQLEGSGIRKYCELGKEEADLLEEVFDRLDLSARAHDRILKVARTIADLGGSDRILVPHLSEAISYRQLDRRFFGGN